MGISKYLPKKTIVGCNVMLACMLGALLPVTWAADYETPPSIAAETLFPGISLQNKYYSIEPMIPTDGFLTRTVIQSEFGDFIATGPGMLEMRLHEIEALVKLQTFEASEEFQSGAKDSATEKWEGLKQVYDHPKEAASGITAGVGRFFKRTYRAGKTGIQTVVDVANDQSPGSVEGAGSNLPGSSQSLALPDTESKYSKAAKASGNTAVNILGFEDSRRKLAKRLGVDPYTTNIVLDSKLDEVTWSIFAGDFGIDMATSLIPGAMIVSTSSLVTNWVWDTPPGDLRVKIDETLVAAGVSQEDVDKLLRHRAYPLSYQAELTSAIGGLAKVDGHEDIMSLALSVTTVDQARFIVSSMQMLLRYHKTIQPLQTINVQGMVTAVNTDNSVVITAPVDYLSWSEKLEIFSKKQTTSNEKHELYIAGTMSMTARSEFQQRDWELHENSGLFSRIQIPKEAKN